MIVLVWKFLKQVLPIILSAFIQILWAKRENLNFQKLKIQKSRYLN